MNFSIVYQDDRVVVMDKPSGFHVHPPENCPEKVPRNKIVLHQLRDQIGHWVYPVHRLDVATSGLLMFALDSEAAGLLCRQFQKQEIKKTYWAVVRGYMPDQGLIDRPLELDSTGELVPCLTDYETLKKIELPFSVGKKYQSSRYSWLKVSPRTGRFHQIRRHMNRIAHPVIGDTDHGDSHHNRFFREDLNISGLCLRAQEIETEWPWTPGSIRITAAVPGKWLKISQVFQS